MKSDKVRAESLRSTAQRVVVNNLLMAFFVLENRRSLCFSVSVLRPGDCNLGASLCLQSPGCLEDPTMKVSVCPITHVVHSQSLGNLLKLILYNVIER